eukprot:TRINITY_DN4960_c0_g1_i1.p1 TRINITY_DN4960_c0_g1~~TRINITY_DN4960_c0_g1_i1.p1  ORF type:complete len:429 (+),score=44.63 TRINITY_DN4960_c0_g1_i1:74-1360(+)
MEAHWYWQRSGRHIFTRYEDEASDRLEAAFTTFEDGGSPTVLIQAATASGPRSYCVDFILMQQSRTDDPTLIRAVLRKQSRLPNDDQQCILPTRHRQPGWQFLTAARCWRNVWPNVSYDLTQAYRAYLSNSDQAARSFNYNYKGTEYEVDWTTCIQRNLATGAKRQLMLLGDIDQQPAEPQMAAAAEPSALLPGNARLAQLQQSAQPQLSASSPRNAVMLALAHAILWHPSNAFCIYGGFPRDCIVRQEEATDIDVRLPTKVMDVNLIQQLLAHLKTHVVMPGIHFPSKCETKGKAMVLRINGGWDGNRIDIDFAPDKIFQQPGVDCSAGNLMLLPQGELGLKIKAVRHVVDLPTTIQHIERKKFVFFYAHEHVKPTPQLGEACKRADKYFERGWACLSPLPSDLLSRLQFQPRLQIEPAYRQNYGFL